MTDPLSRPKEDYHETIQKISSEQSAVGIDAQYTHAIIIEYLKKINARIDTLEQKISTLK